MNAIQPEEVLGKHYMIVIVWDHSYKILED
jgi:hypothetical protein